MFFKTPVWRTTKMFVWKMLNQREIRRAFEGYEPLIRSFCLSWIGTYWTICVSAVRVILNVILKRWPLPFLLSVKWKHTKMTKHSWDKPNLWKWNVGFSFRVPENNNHNLQQINKQKQKTFSVRTRQKEQTRIKEMFFHVTQQMLSKQIYEPFQALLLRLNGTHPCVYS